MAKNTQLYLWTPVIDYFSNLFPYIENIEIKIVRGGKHEMHNEAGLAKRGLVKEQKSKRNEIVKENEEIAYIIIK